MKISVWIDEELLEELDKRAGDEDRSRSWVVGKAVEVYLNPPEKSKPAQTSNEAELRKRLPSPMWGEGKK